MIFYAPLTFDISTDIYKKGKKQQQKHLSPLNDFNEYVILKK